MHIHGRRLVPRPTNTPTYHRTHGPGHLVDAAVLLATASLFALVVVPPASTAPGVTASTEPLLPLDDAYIFVRFAEQLGRGHPLEWTDGVPSSGATSLVHLLLLAPGQLGGDLGLAVRWSQFAGWLTLIALGFASLRLFRSIGLVGLTALAGATTVVLAGPIAWGAMAGMESALNAAAMLLACSLLSDLSRLHHPASRRRILSLVALLGLLPWVRPENGLLAAAAVGFLLLVPAARGHRRLVPSALLPGAALATVYWWLTGTAKPAGILAKSITEFPFVDLAATVEIYGFNLLSKVLPVYLGLRGEALWPPVGWIALAVALGWPFARWLRYRRGSATARNHGHGLEAAGLDIAVACWWIVLLMAPLSAMIEWQYMRHHHAGLALAWTIAVAAVGLGLERLRRGAGLLLAVVPLLLLVALPVWRDAYSRGAAALWDRHGAAGEWLSHRHGDAVLMVNDAGYLAVHYRGAMIDVLGLGTSALARPYRHGPGASLEALARQPRLPDLAAVNRDVFHLPELLGRSLGPPPRRPTDTLIAAVRRDRLEGTILGEEGLDFGSLADESAIGAELGLVWLPPPTPLEPSRVVMATRDGREVLDGCRPLRRALELRSPLAVAGLKVFAPASASAEVVAQDGGGHELGRIIVPAGGWRELRLPSGSVPPPLRFERVSAGIPCLESLRLSG